VGLHPRSEAEEQQEWKTAQRDLQRIRILRESRKRELFSQRLRWVVAITLCTPRSGRDPRRVWLWSRQRITTEYHIYPSFGKRLFFELKVTNPFNREETFVVHCDDPRHELRVVTDEDEWRFLRRVRPQPSAMLPAV